jgi:hypothetical protein
MLEFVQYFVVIACVMGLATLTLVDICDWFSNRLERFKK